VWHKTGSIVRSISSLLPSLLSGWSSDNAAVTAIQLDSAVYNIVLLKKHLIWFDLDQMVIVCLCCRRDTSKSNFRAPCIGRVRHVRAQCLKHREPNALWQHDRCSASQYYRLSSRWPQWLDVDRFEMWLRLLRPPTSRSMRPLGLKSASHWRRAWLDWLAVKNDATYKVTATSLLLVDVSD